MNDHVKELLRAYLAAVASFRMYEVYPLRKKLEELVNDRRQKP